jgi:hypothetical protein
MRPMSYRAIYASGAGSSFTRHLIAHSAARREPVRAAASVSVEVLEATRHLVMEE